MMIRDPALKQMINDSSFTHHAPVIWDGLIPEELRVNQSLTRFAYTSQSDYMHHLFLRLPLTISTN